MSFLDHINRLFKVAHTAFDETVTYEPRVGAIKQISAIITTAESQALTSGTSRMIKNVIVKDADIAPVYGDKITIDSVKWMVELVEKTAPGQWKLTIRNNEKLI